MASMLATRTGLAGAKLAVRAPSARAQRVAAVRVAAQQSVFKIPHDPIIAIASFLGWFAPSNIAVPAFGNQSLFGAFHGAMLQELSHFPTGPALTSPFWVLMITWHMGLFLTMLLGIIGVQGRKQAYW